MVKVNPSRPDPGQRDENQLKFLFSVLLCGASKGLMKGLKAFIKPFEVRQGSVKIKI